MECETYVIVAKGEDWKVDTTEWDDKNTYDMVKEFEETVNEEMGRGPDIYIDWYWYTGEVILRGSDNIRSDLYMSGLKTIRDKIIKKFA